MRKYLPIFLLVLQCTIIFFFSAQPATESSEVSQGLLQKILGIIPATKMLSGAKLNFAEHILRKTAHFSLYSLLGVYAYLSASSFKISKKIISSLGFCLVYAVSDEIHQMFSPGRSCQISDVILDFAGSMVGIFLTVFVIYIIKNRKNKKWGGILK